MDVLDASLTSDPWHCFTAVTLTMTFSLTFVLGHVTEAVELHSEMFRRSADSEGFGVIFDAGSTSTKLKVYKYKRSSSGLPLVELVPMDNTRFSPGLNNFTGNLANLQLYLEKILARATEVVPRAQRAQTHIYVLATAGLRYLSSGESAQLMEDIRSVLYREEVNPFYFRKNHAQVISGEEEGVYLWVSINYLIGFFDSGKPSTQAAGVLEMGGGSTQIAFIPTGPLYAGEYKVRVGGRQFNLYVQSYFHFGQNGIKTQLLHRLKTLSAGENSSSAVIWDPCTLRDDPTSKLLNGSGRPDDCRRLLRELTAPAQGRRCHLKPCAVGNVYQPPLPDTTFYSSGAFTYAPAALNTYQKVVDTQHKLYLDNLELAAFEHCNKSINDLPTKQRRFASSNCLMGVYIPTLLTQSYGFPSDTENIICTNSIKSTKFDDKQKIDWALGAMLLQLSGQTDDAPTPCRSTSSARLPPCVLAPCLLLLVFYFLKR